MTDKTTVDAGNNSVVADESATDNRHIANAKALAIVTGVMKAETALAVTAKEHGLAVFRSVYSDGNNLDMLIGESKLAAGWNNLGNSEAGRKAKQRLNVYFSNYRLVAERWGTLSDEGKAAILDGSNSVHYVASEIRKADAEAKRAAAKAESEASGDTVAEGESLTQLVERVTAAYEAATIEQRNEAFDAIAALVAMVDADTVAQQSEPETETAKAA